MPTIRRWGLVLMMLATPVSAAAAEVDETAIKEAQRYYGAGQKAFIKTEYGAAIAAFERAQKLAPNPAVVYSLAQSHRLRYFVTRTDNDLRRAAGFYRQYLKEAPKGRSRQFAVEHLAAIEPLLARLTPADPATPTPTEKAETRLMVQVTPDNARVSLDGAAAEPAPLISVVKPGRHRIRVEADGYHPKELVRTAAAGTIAVVDVELVPRLGQVTVTAPPGATLYVDGKRVGVAPLATPVELPSGPHRFEVIQNGREAFARQISVTRGGSLLLDAKLRFTAQREAARWVLAGSGVFLIIAGVATGVLLRADTTANDISGKLDAGGALDADEIESFLSAKSNRANATTVAIALYSAAGAGLAAGLLMWFLDEPTPGVAPAVSFEPGGAQVGVRVPLH